MSLFAAAQSADSLVSDQLGGGSITIAQNAITVSWFKGKVPPLPHAPHLP